MSFITKKLEEFDEKFDGGGFGDTKIYFETRAFLSTALNEAIKQPYDVSEWKRVGQERGYWNYFRDEMIKEVEKGLPEEKEIIITGNIMADTLENDEKRGHNDCLNQIKQSLSSLREGNK